MWHLTACKISVTFSFLKWNDFFLSYLWINVGNKIISFQECHPGLKCHKNKKWLFSSYTDSLTQSVEFHRKKNNNKKKRVNEISVINKDAGKWQSSQIQATRAKENHCWITQGPNKDTTSEDTTRSERLYTTWQVFASSSIVYSIEPNDSASEKQRPWSKVSTGSPFVWVEAIQLSPPEDRNRNVKKRTLGHVRPVKIQISLRECAGWSESSLVAFWIAKDTKFLQADSEDSDQTERMRRLIWV